MLSNTEAAKDFIHTLNLFGEQKTNAVLEILGEHRPVKNQKYPHNKLHFANNGWLAYYHCHDTPDKNATEHGHFHLFARTGDNKDWCHVCALSMDDEGQPLAWFMVNQWVTGTPWLPADQVAPLLNTITIPDSITVTEKWLLNLLILFRARITELLFKRDKVLTQIIGDSTVDDIFNNHQIHELCRNTIELESTLIMALNSKAPGTGAKQS
jgi:hypothetical protein